MASGYAYWGIGYAPLFAVALSTGASDAGACSCTGQISVDWPPGDATGVALDTAVVVGGFIDEFIFGDVASAGAIPDAGENVSTLVLVSDEGERISLLRMRGYPTAPCVREFHFAVPSVELSPNTRYALWYGATSLSAFTTGTERRDRDSERAAAERMTFEVLGTTEDPRLVTTAFVKNVAEVPLYVNFVGSEEETTLSLRARALETVQLDFGARECPEVRVLNPTGETLVSRSLCAAERCLTANGLITVSSCGANYAVDIDYDRFRQLPLGCGGDHPNGGDGTGDGSPTGAHGGSSDAGANNEGPQKVAVRPTDRGCTLSAHVPKQRLPVAVFALAVLIVVVCRVQAARPKWQPGAP